MRDPDLARSMPASLRSPEFAMPTACLVCKGNTTWLSISGTRSPNQFLAVRHSKSGSQYFSTQKLRFVANTKSTKIP